MPVLPSTLSRQCAPINLQTAAMVYHHEAPPTVDNIREGERILSACTSDRCNQGREGCPTPDACRLPDPTDWRPFTAGESVKFWLAVLGAPAVVAVVAMVAMFAG